MKQEVDNYLTEGCGRCPLGGTPDCKVHSWTEEIKLLRRIVLDCGLEEEYKWSQPCYTFQNNNVLIVTAFKEYAVVAFFKGSLLKDTHRLLSVPGPYSQAARQFRFTNVRQILEQEALIKAYVFEAIEVEKTGLKVPFKKNPEPIPEELSQKFEEDLAFKTAFENLTPGRQRGYIIHFSQPKQSKTRMARIEKFLPTILQGKGMHDDYRALRK